MGNIRRFARESRSACRGMAVVAVLALWGGAAAAQPYHAADVNRDFRIQLSELLRVVQLFNVGGYHCLPGSEDGYGAGDGPRDCAHHTADTDAGWSIGLSEVLRVTQLHNASGYRYDAEAPDLAAPWFETMMDCQDGLVRFRALPDDLYAPGEPVEITLTISGDVGSTGPYTGWWDPSRITALAIQIIFPGDGWVFDGVAPGSVPLAGVMAPRTLELVWVAVPNLPYTFTIRLLPGNAVHGSQAFVVRLHHRTDGGPIVNECGAVLHEAGPGGTGGGGETPCTNVAFFSHQLHDAVMNALGNPPGGLRLCDLEALESLDLSNSEIDALSNMHIFRNLRYLNLSGNRLHDLSGIEYMPALEHVDLSNNRLGHAYELASSGRFPALTLVDLRGNPLTGHQYCDVTPLFDSMGVTVLQEGECDGESRVTFRDPAVAGAVAVALNSPVHAVYPMDLVAVQVLTIHGASDLAGLEYLTGLRQLKIDGLISDLTPLAGLTGLDFLDLIGTGVADITPLAGLVNLRTLYLDYNQITDLTPLVGLTRLETLWLDENALDDLTPLLALTGLKMLTLNGNLGLDLEVIGQMFWLEGLWLRQAGLEDIGPLVGLAGVQRLNLAGNDIVDLGPLRYLEGLTQLYLSGNPITDLTPLLENEGIGAGDYIFLREMSLTQTMLEQVTMLNARGVWVYR